MTFDKSKGIYRLSVDLPIDLWAAIVALAERENVKPAPIIRRWLTEAITREGKVRR